MRKKRLLNKKMYILNKNKGEINRKTDTNCAQSQDRS